MFWQVSVLIMFIAVIDWCMRKRVWPQIRYALWLLVLVQSALLLAVLALRVRLPSGGLLLGAPVELFVTASLAGLAGIALGLCISVVATTADKATSLIPLVLVPQVLFAGLMFRLKGVTEYLS